MSNSYAVRTIRDHYDYLTPQRIVGWLRHSSFVDMRQRYMYYAVPKAACTSMKTLIHDLKGAGPIRLICGGEYEGRRDMFIHARENVPLPSLVDLDDVAQREVLHSPDFLRMTIVRNPYTRVLSVWRRVMLYEPGSEPQYMAIKGQLPAMTKKDLITLAEFVAYLETEDLRLCDAHWAYQHSYTFMDALNYNFVGKVENVAEVMQRFWQHLGKANPAALERKNVSEEASAGRYDRWLAERVHALYAVDFERFGYSADDWPSGDQSAPPVISEERYCDEIVERNMLLSELYKEVYYLRAEMATANKLHIPKIVNALVKMRDALRRSVS
jgi:hypothetical protein